MKKNLMTSYEKISDQLKLALIETYPDGFEDEIKTHQDMIKGGTFKGLLFGYGDTNYLIRFQNGDYSTYLEETEELENDSSEFEVDNYDD